MRTPCYIEAGTIVSTEDHDAWGYMILARTPDGLDRECRPCFPGVVDAEAGTYPPRPADGTEVLILRPLGSSMACVALLGLPSSAAKPPAEAAGSITAHYGGFEVREAGGDAVEGVLLRPLLDELSTLTGHVKAIVDALTNSTTTAQDGGAAYKAAIVLALTGVSTSLESIKTTIDNSKAGQGEGPLCSPLLRSSG